MDPSVDRGVDPCGDDPCGDDPGDEVFLGITPARVRAAVVAASPVMFICVK